MDVFYLFFADFGFYFMHPDPTYFPAPPNTHPPPLQPSPKTKLTLKGKPKAKAVKPKTNKQRKKEKNLAMEDGGRLDGSHIPPSNSFAITWRDLLPGVIDLVQGL